MELATYKKTIFSRQTFKKFISSFFQILGTIALFLGILDILFPNTLHFGFEGFAIFFSIAFLGAFFTIMSRKVISRQLSIPDTKVTIKVGDLLEEDGYLVIGMNDVFDTEKGDIIKPSSIQGQFLKKIYNDDRLRLDKDLENALQGVSGKKDNQKSKGKNIRYPIGTVATLTVGAKKYFCLAYSYMENNLQAQSDIGRLSVSLEKLWDEIRIKGHRERVTMAVLGSDLARIANASHSDLIKLIILLFILASREKSITQELVIIIHQSNLGKVNLIELNDFLESF